MKILVSQTSLMLCALALAWTGCSTVKTPAPATTVVATNFPALPEGITSFGAATADGWLYVFGGYTGKRHDYSIEKVRGTFYRLNLAGAAPDRIWEPLPSAEPAQGTAIVAYGNYIYRIGGMAAKNHDGEKQDLLSQTIFARYDIAQKIWESLAPLPAGRSTHDAVVVGDKLYVAGGWNLNGDPLGDGAAAAQWHDTLLVADLSRPEPQWQSLPQPFQRRAIAMAAIGPEIYFIGGMTADNDTSRAVDIFDTATGIWSHGPDLPRGIMDGFGFAAVGVGDAIYASGFSGKILRLTAGGAKWETVGKLNEPRFFHRLISLGGGRVLALGGEGSRGKLRDVEVLELH